MTVPPRRRPRRAAFVTTLTATAVFTATAGGCAKSEKDQQAGAQNTQGQQQVVQSPSASAPSCTISKFGGKSFDLKTGVVGFSQSEKEANPFRIAETKSIKDEAKNEGIA